MNDDSRRRAWNEGYRDGFYDRWPKSMTVVYARAYLWGARDRHKAPTPKVGDRHTVTLD